MINIDFKFQPSSNIPPINADAKEVVFIDNYGNWSIGIIKFSRHASFEGIYVEYAPRPYKPAQYLAWAILPNSKEIIEASK